MTQCGNCGGYGEVWIEIAPGQSRLVACDKCAGKPTPSKACTRCGYPADDCGCNQRKVEPDPYIHGYIPTPKRSLY